jgi:hypothetical protein
MKSVDSHGSSLLLFTMRVMVWHFVSDSHKVMTVLIIGLPSMCYFGDFSAISELRFPDHLMDNFGLYIQLIDHIPGSWALFHGRVGIMSYLYHIVERTSSTCMGDLGVLRSLQVALSSDPLLLVFHADICHSLTSNILLCSFLWKIRSKNGCEGYESFQRWSIWHSTR